MDKMNIKVWLKNKIIEATNEMRDTLETYTERSEVVALRKYFSTGDLRRTDIRLNALKTLFKELGNDIIDDVTLSDLAETSVKAIRFALIKCERNPNDHNYGNNYFLVSRETMGIRQDGSFGNNFPSSIDGGYKCPAPRDAEALADKYVAMLGRDCDLKDYFDALKPMIEDFIDFTV